MGDSYLPLLCLGLYASPIPLDSNSGTVDVLWQSLRFNDILQGILVCIGGLGMLVASDKITDKDYPAVSLVKGDIFMIVGATLYGFSA